MLTKHKLDTIIKCIIIKMKLSNYINIYTCNKIQ